MRVTGSRAYATPPPAPTMPPGLVELMEGLAKDVLKNNPENIYEFCAGHMQKLLEIRDGPFAPIKHLTLEQKIAKAQEKIRQRIKHRHLQINKMISSHSSENHEQEQKEQKIVETTVENMESKIQPIHGEDIVIEKEIEVSHKADEIITINDIIAEEPPEAEHKVIEDITVTQNLVTEKLAEKINNEGKEDTTNENKKESPDIELKHVVNVNEHKDIVENNSENVKPTEHVSIEETLTEVSEPVVMTIDNNVDEKIINVGNETNEPLPYEVSVDVLNEADSPTLIVNKSETAISHTDDIVPITVADEPLEKEVRKDELNEAASNLFSAKVPETLISHTDHLETITVGDGLLEKGIIKDELSEVAFSGINSELVFSPTNDIDTINVSDDGPLEKEVIKDELNEVALPQHLVNKSETVPQTEEKNKHTEDTEEEKKIDKEEHVTPDDTLIENVVILESEPEEHVEGEAHLKEEPKIKQTPDDFLLKTQDITVVELSDKLPIPHQSGIPSDDNPLEPLETINQSLSDNESIPHQSRIPLDENPLEPPLETVIQNINSGLQVSVNDAELFEDKLITMQIAEKDNLKNEKLFDHHDMHKNEVDNVIHVDTQILDTDHKLPENEGAYSGVLTVDNDIDNDAGNNSNTIIECDDTIENAVSGMDLETAAITIQKVFRTFLFSKSRASTLEDTVNENSLDEDIEKKDEPEYLLTSANLNQERRALGISRMDTVLQTVNEEKSLSLSDDSSLSSAATTIQAHVRGFFVRNRLASNKTASSSSLVNSDGPSTLSLDGEVNEPKKTILNIHIVPDRGQFMSRDESLLTSIDLPLDNSPPSSINLHPLGYDKSERRKQLKREDAVQSISPPSNNSGKLSEEVESVKDVFDDSVEPKQELDGITVNSHDKPLDGGTESCDTTLTMSSTAETVVDADAYNAREVLSSPEHNLEADNKSQEVVANSSSDEMDVVTPFTTEKNGLADTKITENDETPKLVHSGEFHDIVVQTQVKRSESSVVREFKNVLVYFLLWDKT